MSLIRFKGLMLLALIILFNLPVNIFFSGFIPLSFLAFVINLFILWGFKNGLEFAWEITLISLPFSLFSCFIMCMSIIEETIILHGWNIIFFALLVMGIFPGGLGFLGYQFIVMFARDTGNYWIEYFFTRPSIGKVMAYYLVILFAIVYSILCTRYLLKNEIKNYFKRW